MKQVLLSSREEELIEALRDVRNSKHNPSKSLLKYVTGLFEKLLDDDDDCVDEVETN